MSTDPKTEIPDEPGAEPAVGDEVRIAAPPDTPLEVKPALHERIVWRVCDALGVPRWTAIAEIERTIATLRTERERTIAATNTERERTIAATKRYVAQVLRDVARTGAPEALPPDACERAARIVEDLHGPGPDGALVRARAERLLAVVDAARPWQHGQRCCASAEAAEAAARGPCRPCLLAYALDALDREEREAAPASGDPELAAAVARLEGALVYVEPDESDACEHVGYLGCGRTVRRGPLRDVLVTLARDASEEPDHG